MSSFLPTIVPVEDYNMDRSIIVFEFTITTFIFDDDTVHLDNFRSNRKLI